MHTFDDGRTMGEVAASSNIGQACVYIRWLDLPQHRKIAYASAFKVQGDFDEWCKGRIHSLLDGLHDYLVRAEEFVRYVDQQCLDNLREMVSCGNAQDAGTTRIDHQA